MVHDPNKLVRVLPRGGYQIETPAGTIQFGAPPETIKDSLGEGKSVPQIFVLPTDMFNWQRGINVADMEFPLYYNFFLKNRTKTEILATPIQARRLTTALREAVFGPKNLDLSQDKIDAGDDVYVPDIGPELAYFRRGFSLKDMVQYRLFSGPTVELPGTKITLTTQAHYKVEIDGQYVATIPGKIQNHIRFNVGDRDQRPFIPPRFGVTCLGPSHGFDPNDNTSGFIVWLNGNGIMIDPPVNSSQWLSESNVNPRYVDSIILTHCHADHDAGTFQKILEEGRVSVYTTNTIMGSFLRKYAAFSGESIEQLKRLFTFNPVYMGRCFNLHGGQFEMFYSLHSIPTMGFTIDFQGKRFVYSSDHQGDPEVQQSLQDQGVIDTRRLEQLQQFPWDSDIIYHEAGIAPLHTPISFLNSLSPEIQRRIVAYHISHKDFQAIGDTQLQRASFGIEHTRIIDVKETEYSQAQEALNVIRRLDFLRDISIEKVQEFLSIIHWRNYDEGETIIAQGEPGKFFYILTQGQARVKARGLVRDKLLGAYDYFGEVALLTGQERSAEIVAQSPVRSIVIEKNPFLTFIGGTAFERILHRLIANRSEQTWREVVTNPVFSFLTDFQKMWLESMFEPQELSGPGLLCSEGEELPGIYIVRSGEVEITRRGELVSTLGPGAVVGRFRALQLNEPARYDFIHPGDLEAFYISPSNAIEFLDANPGAAMRMNELIR